jgi:hypothetical protein
MTFPTSTEQKLSTSQRFKSFFKSPASSAYNRVLAESWDQSQAANTNLSAPTDTRDKESDDEDLKAKSPNAAETTFTSAEKAKALAQRRHAESPSGSFVLGHYKPLSATQGHGDYITARGVTGSMDKTADRRA